MQLAQKLLELVIFSAVTVKGRGQLVDFIGDGLNIPLALLALRGGKRRRAIGYKDA